ncbi:integrase [Stappia sp. F7233]|uniref:Integrase n=1 Tax=Stappia albiluteola TaxID=2758565 RepID=A0A839AJ49_9HYPH|nr:DUF6460 domain-containing protein [Stappia albiluteola]MBA5779175.1 integrase [Stappia albiluteola]
MANGTLERFLGGSPGRVLLRLVFLSFVAGVLMSALGLYPLDLLDGVITFIRRLWEAGFEALGRVGHYFVLGAMVVVPVWLVLRVLDLGKR